MNQNHAKPSVWDTLFQHSLSKNLMRYEVYHLTLVCKELRLVPLSRRRSTFEAFPRLLSYKISICHLSLGVSNLVALPLQFVCTTILP